MYKVSYKSEVKPLILISLMLVDILYIYAIMFEEHKDIFLKSLIIGAIIYIPLIISFVYKIRIILRKRWLAKNGELIKGNSFIIEKEITKYDEKVFLKTECYFAGNKYDMKTRIENENDLEKYDKVDILVDPKDVKRYYLAFNIIEK